MKWSKKPNSEATSLRHFIAHAYANDRCTCSLFTLMICQLAISARTGTRVLLLLWMHYICLILFFLVSLGRFVYHTVHFWYMFTFTSAPLQSDCMKGCVLGPENELCLHGCVSDCTKNLVVWKFVNSHVFL